MNKQARQIEQESGTILKTENTHTDRYTDRYTHKGSYGVRLGPKIVNSPFFRSQISLNKTLKCWRCPLSEFCLKYVKIQCAGKYIK